MHALLYVLEREEGSVSAMHYGLFESPAEPIAAAQERSTALLLSRLPAPPARVLEVGIGLGFTLARLTKLGYAAQGITPDPVQAAAARARHGEAITVHVAPLEHYETDRRYDAILFQESSQYIESGALWAKARGLAAPGARVVVLDEFSVRPVEKAGALHGRDAFLEAAARGGFAVTEERDVSAQAAPTVDWFLDRIPKHRAAIAADLGIDAGQVDALVASGRDYRSLYASGAYGYRLFVFSAR